MNKWVKLNISTRKPRPSSIHISHVVPAKRICKIHVSGFFTKFRAFVSRMRSDCVSSVKNISSKFCIKNTFPQSVRCILFSFNTDRYKIFANILQKKNKFHNFEVSQKSDYVVSCCEFCELTEWSVLRCKNELNA